MPVEFELQRAENLSRKIEPQIDYCKQEVAQAEVNPENLQASIRRLEHKVEDQESTLKQGAARLTRVELASAKTASMAANEHIAVDLKRRFEGFKNSEAMLGTKRALHERHQQAVDAARAGLDAVRGEDDRLHELVESLRVQKLQVEAMAAAAPSVRQLDDSALGEAKAVLEGIKNRLDVAQKMLEHDVLYFADDTEAPVAPGLVAAEIHDHFAASEPTELEAVEER